jgi:hypothetical protein
MVSKSRRIRWAGYETHVRKHMCIVFWWKTSRKKDAWNTKAQIEG